MKITLLNLFLLSITVVIASSCNQGKKPDKEESRQDQLYDQIITVHDEVMPKMDDIMKLKNALLEKADSIKKIKGDEKELLALQNAITELEEADEAMMQWMRNFKSQENVADQEKALNYYEQQKKEIDKVKEKMLTAIEEGKNTLKNFN